CSVSGDTRFDRVIEIAENFNPIPEIEKFIQNNPVIVAGSTWPEDENVLKTAFKSLNNNAARLIIVPHEIHEGHIKDLKTIFPDSVLFSTLKDGFKSPENNRILIIDNIGMLSRLYKYAGVAYVGGGLQSTGVHNVLEAAVYNKPVIIGPHYEKYQEAIDLVNSGGGIVIKDAGALSDRFMQLLNNQNGIYDKTSHAAGTFVRANGGATGKILSFIQENRLLTN
ncbi:MAG TPA: 3-deoxy-D-manno-octulosonic acid transferase, partial [Chitinophagaceae bacterium]|nr:3-deoxy-D-manno-octulosonic acid transferase [Chitinophagaceae bacterium]